VNSSPSAQVEIDCRPATGGTARFSDFAFPGVYVVVGEEDASQRSLPLGIAAAGNENSRIAVIR